MMCLDRIVSVDCYHGKNGAGISTYFHDYHIYDSLPSILLRLFSWKFVSYGKYFNENNAGKY